MSCYQWERGTIIIPRKEWASFRTRILKEWNQEQVELLHDCQLAYSYIVTATKGMRGEKRGLAQNGAIHKYCGDRKCSHGHYEDSERYRRLYRVLFSWRNKRKFARPKKKDMYIVRTSKSAVLALDEAEISFENDKHSVSWDVEENNWSVEAAHKNSFAIYFFRELSNVTWTRNTGGKIWGNDEINTHEGRSQGEGGGGNYITRRFGPLGFLGL